MIKHLKLFCKPDAVTEWAPFFMMTTPVPMTIKFSYVDKDYIYKEEEYIIKQNNLWEMDPITYTPDKKDIGFFTSLNDEQNCHIKLYCGKDVTGKTENTFFQLFYNCKNDFLSYFVDCELKYDITYSSDVLNLFCGDGQQGSQILTIRKYDIIIDNFLRISHFKKEICDIDKNNVLKIRKLDISYRISLVLCEKGWNANFCIISISSIGNDTVVYSTMNECSRKIKIYTDNENVYINSTTNYMFKLRFAYNAEIDKIIDINEIDLSILDKINIGLCEDFQLNYDNYNARPAADAQIVYNKDSNMMGFLVGTSYLNYDGMYLGIKRSGNSNNRPKNIYIGFIYFDTSIGKPIWYKGDDVWVDATGANV